MCAPRTHTQEPGIIVWKDRCYSSSGPARRLYSKVCAGCESRRHAGLRGKSCPRRYRAGRRGCVEFLCRRSHRGAALSGPNNPTQRYVLRTAARGRRSKGPKCRDLSAARYRTCSHPRRRHLGADQQTLDRKLSISSGSRMTLRKWNAVRQYSATNVHLVAPKLPRSVSEGKRTWNGREENDANDVVDDARSRHRMCQRVIVEQRIT